MASNPGITIKIEAAAGNYVMQAMTGPLRASGWRPWKELPCGCNPDALCADHARIRAEEHYR